MFTFVSWSAKTLLDAGVGLFENCFGLSMISTGKNLNRGAPFALGGRVSVPLNVGFAGSGRLKISSAASPEACNVPKRCNGPFTSPEMQTELA